MLHKGVECEELSLRDQLRSVSSMSTAKLIMNTLGAGLPVTVNMLDGSVLKLVDRLTALRTLRQAFGWKPDF